MKVLLLSAYDAMSHRYWREGLCRHFDNIKWVVLTLPPRYFKWRIRGNPLSWLNAPELRDEYDLVLATSMVDLAVLRGLFPNLASVPTIVYFHENQFAYPISKNQHLVEPQMVSLYSALAADKVLFNSRYNFHSFFSGLENSLVKFPDLVPKGLPSMIKAKSEVLSVPLDAELFQFSQRLKKNILLNVVWNHRWEYDKGVDRLLRAVALLPKNLRLQLHVIGQNFRSEPKEFVQLRALLQQNGMLGRWGFIDKSADYRAFLSTCDVVLSTSVHDFQGLSVMEATALGCLPLVPARLAYTEIFAQEFHYLSDMENLNNEAASLAARLIQLVDAYPHIPAAPQMDKWSWAILGPEYRRIFTSYSVA